MLHHAGPGDADEPARAKIIPATARAGVILNFNNDTLSSSSEHIHSTPAVHFHYTFGELPGVWSAPIFRTCCIFHVALKIAAAEEAASRWCTLPLIQSAPHDVRLVISANAARQTWSHHHIHHRLSLSGGNLGLLFSLWNALREQKENQYLFICSCVLCLCIQKHRWEPLYVWFRPTRSIVRMRIHSRSSTICMPCVYETGEIHPARRRHAAFLFDKWLQTKYLSY